STPRRPAARQGRAARSAQALGLAQGPRRPASRRVRCGPARWRATHSPAGDAGHEGQGMVNQVFFHRVAVDPGDRAQPAGDRCTRAPTENEHRASAPPRRGTLPHREVEVGNNNQAAAGQAREGDEQARAPSELMRDPSRVLALSDGVFAIIMTLLVLEIRVPQLSAGASLAGALRQLRPSLTPFVVSFILAGMYWVGHRDLFGLIRRTDRGLVWLNIVYLLPLCLLPFGAGMLGRYDREPAALRIYGLIVFAIAVMR